MPRRTTSLAAAALLVGVLAGCGDDDVTPAISGALPEAEEEVTTTTEAEDEAVSTAAVEVELLAEDEASIGFAVITPEGEGVRFDVVLAGLTPGFHAMHVHDVGECDPGGRRPFSSAEGHYVGEGGEHGDHDGDLPPLLVLDDGTADARFVTDAVTLEELTEGDASALIVHEGRDNQANIPERYTSDDGEAPGPDAETLETGDAGGRVACGVVEPAAVAAEDEAAAEEGGTEEGGTEGEAAEEETAEDDAAGSEG